ERGHCGGIRWDGQSDGIRSAWRGDSPLQSDHLVSRHFYGDLNHAFYLRRAPLWLKFGAPGPEACADQVSTRETSNTAGDAPAASPNQKVVIWLSAISCQLSATFPDFSEFPRKR